LAGIIDGEGSINISRSTHNSYSMSLIIQMASKETMTFIKENFTGHSYAISVKNSKSVFYRWQVSGPAAARLLERVLPYLLEKKRQALLAMEYQSHIGTGGYASTYLLSTEEIKLRDDMHDKMIELHHANIKKKGGDIKCLKEKLKSSQGLKTRKM